ncbi:MAG: discoidin domain-containing protein [Dysgonomonas sp.]
MTSQFSDSPKGSDVGKAVDNNKSTNFVTSQSKYYILWKGAKTTAINYYTITSATDAPEKDPKTWTLSGSNDNKVWTLLDTQTNQAFSTRQETKEYEFDNEVVYQYYKLDIQSNNGGTTTQIAEWTMEVKIDPNAPYSVAVDSYNKNPLAELN